MKLIKTDFDSAAKVAKQFNNSHISIEALFYSLCDKPKFIEYVKNFNASVNILKLQETFRKFLLEQSCQVEIESPSPSFRYERIIKRAYACSLLTDSKDIKFEELIYSITEEGSNTNIYSILAKSNIIPKDLNKTLNKGNGLFKTQEEMVEDKNVNLIEFLKHTSNLNDEVRKNKFKPSIGREKEILEVQRILLRKNKNSLMITGEPGVGKSNLIETLAQQINDSQVHEELRNLKIFSLNIHSVLSDIKYHGILEARLNAIFSVLQADHNKILFIDEIHMLYNAGSNNSNLDIMNFLKAPLSKNKIRIIGATTNTEYRRYIEKNAAFTRRFAQVNVPEPTTKETVNILKNSKEDFEKFYGIPISNSIIEQTVDLTNLYVKNRFNPDKSLDLLDSMLARKKLQGKTNIKLNDVFREISIECKIPSDEITLSKNEQLVKLESHLKTQIIGQDTAIDTIMKNIKVGWAGLKDKEKPLASFLVRGPTSTGKTETAKLVANFLNIPFLRYDMSAFQEKHTVSGLIGSPPGYVGFDDGASGSGKLINDIDKNHHCVLLLDEIEKGHPDILNVLLQVMDYGKLTSSSGKDVYFNKVIIFMTTNIGSEEAERNGIGFKVTSSEQDNIDETINKFLRPEFRARLDDIVNYKPLSKVSLLTILDNQLNQLNTLIEKYKINLFIDSAVREYIVNKAIESKLGARYIDKLITNEIKTKLSSVVLSKSGKSTLNKKIVMDAQNIIDIV